MANDEKTTIDMDSIIKALKENVDFKEFIKDENVALVKEQMDPVVKDFTGKINDMFGEMNKEIEKVSTSLSEKNSNFEKSLSEKLENEKNQAKTSDVDDDSDLTTDLFKTTS